MSELGSIGFLLVRERFCSLYRREGVFDNLADSEEFNDILNGIKNVLKSKKKTFSLARSTKSSAVLALPESINEEVVRFRNDEPHLKVSKPIDNSNTQIKHKEDVIVLAEKSKTPKQQSSIDSKAYKRSESIKSNGFTLEIHPVILYSSFLIRPKNILNPLGDKIYPLSDKNKSEPLFRGGEPYYRPYGWKRYGLKVSLLKYENDKWLSNDGNSDEWAVAYHGLRTSKSLEKILLKHDNQGCRFQPHFSVGKAQRYVQNKDINTKTSNFGKLCGSGIYLSTNVLEAEKFTCNFVLNENTYKVLLQCRVKPSSIRKPNQNVLIIPNSDDIRPYGILIKTV
jgi:hypothetical protein